MDGSPSDVEQPRQTAGRAGRPQPWAQGTSASSRPLYVDLQTDIQTELIRAVKLLIIFNRVNRAIIF